jgi:hypothetical protein
MDGGDATVIVTRKVSGRRGSWVKDAVVEAGQHTRNRGLANGRECWRAGEKVDVTCAIKATVHPTAGFPIVLTDC